MQLKRTKKITLSHFNNSVLRQWEHQKKISEEKLIGANHSDIVNVVSCNCKAWHGVAHGWGDGSRSLFTLAARRRFKNEHSIPVTRLMLCGWP